MSTQGEQELSIDTPDGVRLAGTIAGRHGGRTASGSAGEGAPIVLLHGLTATRRYLLMGSRALERSGYATIAYDARGHGHSSPAPAPDAYTYELLAQDLLAVLDALEIERAVLAGASMGAHTALGLALAHPERVLALALITPAFDPDTHGDTASYASWDRLAAGLEEGGVEGFVAAYDLDAVPERLRDTVATVLRQRLSAHEHPLAVADALRAIPRSRPFERWEQLHRIGVATVAIASRDEADPTHPLALGERYAREIPGAKLLVEQPGNSPIAWQGGQLSRVLAELTESARAGAA